MFSRFVCRLFNSESEAILRGRTEKSITKPMAHDSVSLWLSDETLTPKMLWEQSQHLVEQATGYLIIDDTVLDKQYA